MSGRVAIVGSGPAGAYAALQLRASRWRPEVDLFDRLPTPWGLLRGGVAPDHQEIKVLGQWFDEQVMVDGVRFFGGVEVGTHVSHAELAEHYSAVVYAIGAQSSRDLGIEGEALRGSLAAPDFVGWYNGHPDFRGYEPDLSHPRAVIVGNGNVAADVARILTRPVDALARTDIADHALAALRESRVEEVVVLGRRGPAQAAFTAAEVGDLVKLDGVDLVVDPAEAELDALSRDWLAEEGTYTARRNVAHFQAAAAAGPSGAPRRIVLRFLRSPVRLLGDDHVTGIEVARTRLERDERGTVRAITTDETETIECGLVLRSVGYRAVPLPDVPFDERAYVLPNERGRVIDAESGEPLPGVYATGWIKRGPTGILGTNKRDAQETVDCLLEDAGAGRLPAAGDADGSRIAALVAERAPEHVDFTGWSAIDAAELAAGRDQDRPRVKLGSTGQLLAAARGG